MNKLLQVLFRVNLLIKKSDELDGVLQHVAQFQRINDYRKVLPYGLSRLNQPAESDLQASRTHLVMVKALLSFLRYVTLLNIVMIERPTHSIQFRICSCTKFDIFIQLSHFAYFSNRCYWQMHCSRLSIRFIFCLRRNTFVGDSKERHNRE